MTISDDEKEEFYMEAAFEDNAITLEVPEEYDWCTDNKKERVEAQEEEFGRVLQFLTARRPVDYQRTLAKATEKEVDDWFTTPNITMGAQLKEKEEKEAKLLLYTWRDAFASQIEEMPVTDLVEHRIPVYPGAQPRHTKDKIYTKEERDWLDANLPQLERAGVIGRSESPWSHRTKFVRKEDGGLRMVHVFCPVNEATMLSSYRMKWIEPVINNLMLSKYSIYFQADAANGFWAVPMYPPHGYRTSFSTYDGEWQYLRMGQGHSGAPQTYTRMKDIFSRYISAPNPEPTLNKSSSRAFECFVDEDFGAHPHFSSQFEFLHNHYFPRLMWARLTLKGSKSRFFLNKISPRGYESDGSGLWPSLDKVKAIWEYPQPTCLAEIERFLYLTIFLRQFIPGRVKHGRILKEAVQYTDNSDGIMNRTWIPNGKRRHPKRVECGMQWKGKQETAFTAVKMSIIGNVVYGDDETKQYHLMTDASTYAIGSVLFQLPNVAAGTNMSVTMRKEMKVIMFISKRLLSAETRYTTTEREALAILRYLEEVRWLILGSPYTTKVYTDYSALVSLLKKDDAHRRIIRWQVRLSEYDIEYIHIPGRENALADGLSRMRVMESMFAEDGKAFDGGLKVYALEEDSTSGWEEWLEDEWYGAVVHFKLFGDFSIYRDGNGEPLTLH